MSDCKPVRTKPPATQRSRTTAGARSAAGARSRSRSVPIAVERNTTSTESIAASIVSLMVLAADSGIPREFDTTDKNSLQAKAALAQLIAVRFDADD